MPFSWKMTAVYIGVNALLMLLLALNVIRTRYRTRTGLGDEGRPEMLLAIRAHANNTEYVPIALILLLTLAALGANILLIHAVGLPLTAGRLIHAYGLLGPNFWSRHTATPARRWGMILTVLAIVVGAVAAMWLVATAPD